MGGGRSGLTRIRIRQYRYIENTLRPHTKKTTLLWRNSELKNNLICTSCCSHCTSICFDYTMCIRCDDDQLYINALFSFAQGKIIFLIYEYWVGCVLNVDSSTPYCTAFTFCVLSDFGVLFKRGNQLTIVLIWCNWCWHSNK